MAAGQLGVFHLPAKHREKVGESSAQILINHIFD